MRRAVLSNLDRYPALLPAILLTAVAVVFAVIGYVSAAPDGGAPAATTEPVSNSGATFITGKVESIAADSITLSTADGSVTLRLAPDAPYERADAATLAGLREGDWLNATALPHEQTIFVLQGIVVIPAGLLGEAP